jgi:hypothetical protein
MLMSPTKAQRVAGVAKAVRGLGAMVRGLPLTNETAVSMHVMALQVVRAVTLEDLMVEHRAALRDAERVFRDRCLAAGVVPMGFMGD